MSQLQPQAHVAVSSDGVVLPLQQWLGTMNVLIPTVMEVQFLSTSVFFLLHLIFEDPIQADTGC